MRRIIPDCRRSGFGSATKRLPIRRGRQWDGRLRYASLVCVHNGAAAHLIKSRTVPSRSRLGVGRSPGGRSVHRRAEQIPEEWFAGVIPWLFNSPCPDEMVRPVEPDD